VAGGRQQILERRKLMKKIVLRILLATLLLLACESTPVLADGTVPGPWCCPGCTCN
jgi:uncharacterized lipoprotein YajG